MLFRSRYVLNSCTADSLSVGSLSGVTDDRFNSGRQKNVRVNVSPSNFADESVNSPVSISFALNCGEFSSLTIRLMASGLELQDASNAAGAIPNVSAIAMACRLINLIIIIGFLY